MDNHQYSDPAFTEILSKEGNSICNDCCLPNPTWSSVSNAILLCSQCARKHQLLNKNCSYIRSIEVDLWDKDEIQLLKLGGNIRFNCFLEEYHIPLLCNADYKYQNNASNYYRKLLINEARRIFNVNPKPNLYQGILPIENIRNITIPLEVCDIIHSHDNDMIEGMNQQQHQQEEPDDFNESIKNIGSVFISFGNNVKETFNDMKIKEKLNGTGETAMKFAQESKEYLKQKKNEVVESEMFKNIQEKTSSGIDIIKTKANELLNNDNTMHNTGNFDK